jgi:TrmH RNA methyltransferase
MSASNKKSSAAKSRDPLQKPWQRQTKAKAAVSQSATVGVGLPKVAAKETAKAPRQEESKVYGENACRELFRQRPEAIIRLYISPFLISLGSKLLLRSLGVSSSLSP